MSEALTGTIISAVIAGVFNLISKRMELGHVRSGDKVMTTPTGGIVMQPAGDAVNFGLILRHIGILQFILNIVGFLLGLGMGLTGASFESILVAVLFVGTILLSIGFAWSGQKVPKAFRWQHLSWIAIGVAITTLLINSIFMQTPITGLAIVVAFLQSFISMGIGGFVANQIRPNN